MESNLSSLAAWGLLVVSAAWPATAADPVALEPIDGLYSRPLLVTHAGDHTGRLFVVEQGGRIFVINRGQRLTTPFLDLTGQVSGGNEQGLLGLAFHPDFRSNGFFFVNYTDNRGDTVVARFSVSSDPNRADGSSEVEVLTFRQPFSNHNGGHLAFGPDGFLYISSGDGGSGGDPQNNAQDLDSLLGKILRIDVDGLPLAIPPDNPFVGDGSARDEIWSFGLRNPWRFSFDRNSGDLYVGDVGQSRQEEINYQRAGSSGGENYGWRLKEGMGCFNPSSGCDRPGLVDPILTYSHSQGCSVTGGYVYRGPSAPALKGLYLYGDFCSGTIWAAEPRADGLWQSTTLLRSGLSITSFGEGENGDVFVVDRGGRVFRITSSSILVDGFESGSTAAWNREVGNVSVVQPGLDNSGFALEVVTTGTRKKSFVLSRKPNRESTLSITLRIDPNGVDLDGGQVDIVHLASGRKPIAILRLAAAGNRYEVVLLVREDSGGLTEIGRTLLNRNNATKIGVEWARASGNATADGSAILIKGRRNRTERRNLQNRRWAIKAVRAGLPKGSAQADSGSILLDEFIVTR
jgi:glucose/arabinose dehydrogenase